MSATNFLYNLIDTPGGIIRYVREGRMIWPLTLLISVGTLPGILAGYYIRVRFLPKPRSFKLFGGIVLLYLGLRMGQKVLLPGRTAGAKRESSDFFVSNIRCSLSRVNFDFQARQVEFSVATILLLSF